MEGPRIIAAFVQGTLEDVAPAHLDEGRRIRERIPPEHMELLLGTSKVGWLPVEVDVELTEALFFVLGPARAREAFRDGLSDALTTPLLQPVVSAARAVLGAGPSQMFKWAPRLWQLIYRECGTMVVDELSEGSARVSLVGLPKMICDSNVYLDGTAESLRGYFDSIDHDSQAELDTRRLSSGVAGIELNWRPRARIMHEGA